MIKGRSTETPYDKTIHNKLNESVLTDINLSVISNISPTKVNFENMNLNENSNANTYTSEHLVISKDQYSCTQCELPPEILFDTEKANTIKIKCKRHGTKPFLINDYLQTMSKNTYHYYKCGICQKYNQKNFEEETFKYCYHCKKIVCPKCLINHKTFREHKKIFFSNEINIRCETHLGEKYNMFCYDCEKNICKTCAENEHNNHFCIFLKELYPPIDVVEKINLTIDDLKHELNNLIKKVESLKNIILLNELILYTYEKYESNYHHIINVSNLYKSITSNNKNENIISNILDSNDKKTPNNPRQFLNLSIYKFNLKINRNLRCIRNSSKRASMKNINKMKSLKAKYEDNNSLKSIINDKNMIQFNKKYNINITPDSNQILLNNLKIDDNDFKLLCTFNFNKLTKIYLSENNITNLTPLTLIKSQKIEELYMDNNNITNLDAFKNLNINSLKDLILYCNEISSIDVLSGLSFSNLIQLNLYKNKVSNIDSLSKIKMPKLQILHLGFNKITNIDVLEYVDFPELISLNLNRNEITSIGVLEKVNFKKLESLDFFDNKITNIDILSKVSLPSLKSLNFWINNIHSIQLLYKANFQKLEKLNLSNNNISDISTIIYFKFPSLKELNFQYNKINPEEGKTKNILNEVKKKIQILIV